MSGTKKLFAITQHASDLSLEGKTFHEIVNIVADDWDLPVYLAEAIVESWWDGKVMQNFDWTEKEVGC